MNNIFLYPLAIVVTIGLLIAFHEFGHFWVARRCGIRVLRFAIGFGPNLWRHRGRDGTEYCIAAIPLGGYVKMLDEREGTVHANERHLAFNNKTLAIRSLVVVAGPVFNLLMAVAAFWLSFLLGVVGPSAIIGEKSTAPGLHAGDRITAIDEQSVSTWNSARIALIDSLFNQQGAIVLNLVDAQGASYSQPLPRPKEPQLSNTEDPFLQLGIHPWRPLISPRIGTVIDGGAAQQAGLQAGDLLRRADGEEVTDWGQWVDLIRAHPAQTLALEIERNGAIKKLLLTPKSQQKNGHTQGFIGASLDEKTLSAIRDRYYSLQRYGPLAALLQALRQTWRMSHLTLTMFGHMLRGNIGLEQLSGPITIAQLAGRSAAAGWSPFLSFIALISLSLGILNLLPIPLLDGGHLLYYGIEWVRGKPLSERAQRMGQFIGMALLAALIVTALYNDFVRLFGGW